MGQSGPGASRKAGPEGVASEMGLQGAHVDDEDRGCRFSFAVA